MLVIRFLRKGKKRQPFYKIVVTDKRKPPKGGNFKEQVGFYNPLTKEKAIKKDRIEYWLSKGAQLSDTVHNLLVKDGAVKKPKIDVHKKSKKKEEDKKPLSSEAPKGAKEGEDKKPEKPLSSDVSSVAPAGAKEEALAGAKEEAPAGGEAKEEKPELKPEPEKSDEQDKNKQETK